MTAKTEANFLSELDNCIYVVHYYVVHYFTYTDNTDSILSTHEFT